jgi:predicted oxidoreductase
MTAAGPSGDLIDVVVVGAGAAGAAAFLEAADTGATVLGIDQLAAFGGTAATSGGGCCVAGTASQRARGIVDAPELAVADLVAAAGGQAHEPWARRYFEQSAGHVHDWLVDLGLEFVDVRGHDNTSVPRWHQPRGNGRGLMDVLWRAVVDRDLADRWLWSTTVTDLLTAGDAIGGVMTTDAGGREHPVRAGAVVMATGGFAGDRDQVLEHAPALRSVERLLVGGGAGALGTGHRILARRGAVLAHTENICAYAYATPDYRDAAGLRGLVVRRIDDAIWVNRAGHRFHDESRAGPDAGTPAVLAQQPPTCWAILDRPMALGMRVADPYFRDTAAERIEELLDGSPFIHAADEPAGLARAAGIDPIVLARTVADWNARIAAGVERDPATGRSLVGVRGILEPPLYAMQFFPLARKTLGGVRTDLECRVLDATGTAIPGLFAAGELAGFGGGHLSGRGTIEGLMIGASLYGGRVAGAAAARAALEPTG